MAATSRVLRATGRLDVIRRALASGPTESATMQAVTLAKPGGPLLFSTDVPRPAAAGNKVRVKIAACGICHRDVLDRNGAFPFMQQPTILGHEIAGTVDQVGEAVRGLSIGDRVVSLHWASCGTCTPCKRGRGTECGAPEDFLALTANGGYAEYVVAGDSAFVRVPDGWSAVQAAPVQCTYGTVWHGAITRGGLQPGETVLVTGASGGVGAAAVRLASRLGCKVIGTTTSEKKVAFIRSLGADHVVVAPDNKFFKDSRVKGGVDMVLECVGAPTFEASLRSIGRGGRVVLIGNVTVGQAPVRLGGLIINSQQIIGTDSCTAAELEQVFAFMDKTGIKPDIAATIPLADAAKAHEMLENRAVQGRVVLTVGSGQW